MPVKVFLVAFSNATHFTSMNPLYDKYASAATNNPTTTAAIFITFFIAYPATAPNRNPPPAENTKSSIGNSTATTPRRNRKNDEYTISNKIFDFSRKTIKQLRESGYNNSQDLSDVQYRGELFY